ncbi:MAG: hypothetical protein OHK0024_35700 [Thalassobaculales bacterium]
MAGTESAPFRWRFLRIGGFDQARIERGSDLAALDRLDQKLWMALSCPAKGLEFDGRTLALIDAEADGRIRAPEVIAACQWAARMLTDVELLASPGDSLPLAAIDDSHEEGRRLKASARQILANLGKGEAAAIGLEDVADTARIFAATLFNGDGVIPPEAGEDAATRQVLADILSCLPAATDRSGKPGVNLAMAERFFAEVDALCAWWRAGEEPALQPLGPATAEAAALVAALAPKIDDYFARCALAAFDPRAAEAVNGTPDELRALAAGTLTQDAPAIAALPLARAEAGRPLPLLAGTNPAWAARLARLAALAEPLIGAHATLTEAQWQAVRDRLAGHAAWQAARPATVVEGLGRDRLEAIQAGPARAAVAALIARDQALEPEALAIESVERLIRYRRDLMTLANNFVAFRDFYARRAKAIFQAGTLYLDGRSCELCLAVEDAAKHAALATLSRIYLIYCECVRRGGPERMTIVAALTAGDADQLRVGRNGIFYDRQGRDWDATVVRLVEHPISLQQAFWAPYKRVARMVGEQAEKLAAARGKDIEGKVANAALKMATSEPRPAPAPAAAAPPPPMPFDAARFAGIFAAIGLAIGAIGTALASVVTGLLALPWWQLPLAGAGAILLVSGPSMLIAFFKLRQRTLGPLLDASGWAVNARAIINIPFGAALTATARLPEGAERALTDPFAEKRRPWGLWAGLAALGLAAAAAAWLTRALWLP